jgi:MATH domain
MCQIRHFHHWQIQMADKSLSRLLQSGKFRLHIYQSILHAKSIAGEARTKYSLYFLNPNGTPFHQRNLLHNFKGKGNWGYHGFLKRDILEASSCFNDDSFTIACNAVVIKEPRKDMVPSSDIHDRLSNLLSTGIGTHVDFVVNDEVLHAH